MNLKSLSTLQITLGLSIVAAIARMHDGGTLAQALPGGTRIGFSLR